MSTQAGLRRFVSGPTAAASANYRAPKVARPVGEYCEMCGIDVGAEHRHVVDLDTRRLMCSCRPCGLLFTASGAGRGNFRTVPDRYLTDPEFVLDEVLWDDLGVPVAVAFFFHNSVLGNVVAHYPSPAGATESLLDLTAWAAVVAQNPLVGALEPDVEALVIRRPDEAYLVPIDTCYELVGLIRMHWAGFDGGPQVNDDLDRFFADAHARAQRLDRADG